MKSSKVTFIFIPREEAEQKTLSLHHRTYFLLKTAAFIFLLLIIASYVLLIPRAKKYSEYKEKMETYRAQEKELVQLLQDVNKMKQFNTYIRELLGMELAADYQDYQKINQAGQGSENRNYLSGIPHLAPVRGVITKKFMSGARRHYGVDIAGTTGDPVQACADGLVVFSGWTPEL